MRQAFLLGLAWTVCAPSTTGRTQMPLTTLELTVLGLELRVTPDPLYVPKSIPGLVTVSLASGDASPDDDTFTTLTDGAHLEATLRGPGFPTYRVVGPPDEPLRLPPLHVVGEYRLDDIRLVDTHTGEVRLEASPPSIAVHVFPEVLVAQVTSRPLTAAEIEDKGIVIDERNFSVTEFAILFAIEGESFPVRFPVVAPRFAQSTELVPIDEIQSALARAKEINAELAQAVPLPPELSLPGLGIQVAPTLFQMVLPEDEVELGPIMPSIPGLVVIPGEIAFLNQFFSVQVFVANAAPAGSRLSVHSLSARVHLPLGTDRLPASSWHDPGDDPLRLARVGAAAETFDTLPVRHVGSDGVAATADDRDRLFPGESGQAEFLIEGLREGLHLLDIDLFATLDGLGGREIPVTGKAAGSILVRNPKFSLAFSHPRTIRSGEPYVASATVLNTSSTPANLVALTLHGSAISGTELVSDETVPLGDLLPGQAATAEWRFIARRTGTIRFSNLESGDGLSGRFNLTMGIDERGVALSPAAIGYPDYVADLPEALRAAADRVLGQALSVATAAQLPPGVTRLSKAAVTQRVIELAEAGQRLRYGDPPARVLPDLLLDWQGARHASAGFDQILATTAAGAALRDALGVALDAGTTPLAARAADLAGRRLAWTFLASDLATLVPASAPAKPEPPTYAYAGEHGHWLVTTSELIALTAAADHPATTVSRLALDGLGAGVLTSWSLPPATAGTCYHLAAQSLTLTIDPGCDGTASTSVTGTSQPVAEAPPWVVVARQDTAVRAGRPDPPCPPPSYRNYGTIVAVLFSKPMHAASAEDAAGYQLDNGAFATAARLQPGGRVALVNLRTPVGTLVPRTLAVRGARDLGGALVDEQVPLATDADLGVRVKGRVLDQAGSPVAGIPVTLTMYDQQATPFGCLPATRRISQILTDAAGEFRFDFVMAGVGYSVSATNTRALSDQALALLLTSLRPDGDLTAEDLLRIAAERGFSDLLSALAAGSLGQAVAIVEGLDRALVRDTIGVSSPRVGTEVSIVLRFRGRGAVEGRVVDALARPLPAVAVNLMPDPDSRELGRGVFSDASGRFAFAGVPLGRYTIDARSAAGLSRRVSDLLEAPGETDVHDLVLSELAAPTGTLLGNVVHADGVTPDPGARVFLMLDHASALMATSADAYGHFRFDRVPVGTWRVLAVAFGGHVTGTRSGLSVTADSETWALVTLQGTATVHGQVRFANGLPAAGALVAGGEALVTTDPLGLFTLTGVPTGKRTIQAGIAADPANGIAFTRLGSASLEVVSGDDNAVIVTLAAAGRIHGRVLSAAGHPVPNLLVAMPGPFGFRYTKADGLGGYLFDNLALGKHLLSAPAPAVDRTAAQIDQLLAQLQAAQSVEQIAAAMGEAAELYAGLSTVPSAGGVAGSDWGYVRTSLDFDGHVREADIQLFVRGDISGVVHNENGTPIGARVSLTGTAPGDSGAPTSKLIATTMSDPALGTFSFRGVTLPGPYSLSATSPFYPSAASLSGTISPASPEVSGLVLRFAPRAAETLGRLTGVVLAPDGTAAGAGVEVILTRSPLYSLQTDEHGRFDSVRSLPTGAYTLEAIGPVPPGHVGVLGVRLRGGDNDVVLQLLGFCPGLEVRVEDSLGAPVSDATVDIVHASYPRDGDRSLPTDQDGRALAAELREGSYFVKACKALGLVRICASAAATVAHDDLAPRALTLKLAATGMIRGAFFAADALTPIAHAQITIQRLGFVATDEAGAFEVDDVPAGSYELIARDALTGRHAMGKVSVLSGQVAEVRLIVSALGTVRGVVIGTDGASPVPTALVQLDDSDPLTPSVSVTTDPAGLFEIPGVPFGAVSLLARDPLSPLFARAQGSLDEARPILDLELRLPLRGSVAGVIHEADGAPAAFATVKLAGQTKAADPDGRVVFTDLALGRHTVSATSAEPQATNSRGSSEVVIDGATPAEDFAITLSGVGAVAVAVEYDDGSPAIGAVVTLRAGQLTRTLLAETPDAEVVFTDLPLSSYTVSANDGTVGGTIAGTLDHADQLDELVLRLGPAGAVVGRVLSADGQLPVAGAIVIADFAAVAGGLGKRTTSTDEDGTFAFEDLPHGAIAVEVLAASRGGLQRQSGELASELLDLGDILLDEAYPAVLSVDPPDGAGDVPTGASPITLVFSEALAPASIKSAGIFLRVRGGAKLGAALALVAGTSGALDTITLTPQAPLASNTTYEIVVLGGLVQTLSGTLLGPTDLVDRPLIASFSASFSTGDGDPPQLVSLSPAPGAVQIDPSAVVRAVFSEPIDAGASFVLEGPSGVIASRVDLGLDGRSLVLTPLLPLPLDATLIATLSGVKDRAGNFALAQPFITTFASLDTTGPRIASLTTDGATPRAGATLMVTALLDEPEPAVRVRMSLDFATVGETAPGVLSLTFALPSTPGLAVVRAIAIDTYGNEGPIAELPLVIEANAPPTVTLERLSPLTGPARSGQIFSLRALGDDDDAVVTLAGSLSGALTVTQQVSGPGPLALSGLVPASTGPGATITASATATDSSGVTSTPATLVLDVSDGAAPTLQLLGAPAEPVVPGTRLTITAQAADAFGVSRLDLSVSGAFSASDSHQPPTPAPSLEHDFAIDVPADLSGGLFKISVTARDAANNHTTAHIDLSVKDVVPPAIVATSPADGATFIAITSVITVTFDEALAAASVTSSSLVLDPPADGTITRPSPQTIRFTPTSPLAWGTSYQVTVSGVTDLAGNPLPSPYVFSFTTIAQDIEGPAFISLEPADGATGLSLRPTLRATFDSNLAADSVDPEDFVLLAPDDQIVSATLVHLGAALELTPDAALAPSTSYRARLFGELTDLDGNPAFSDAGFLDVAAITHAFSTLLVDIVTPDDGERVVEGQRVLLEVDADPHALLYLVRFFADGLLVASATSAPFLAELTVPLIQNLPAASLLLGAEVKGFGLPGTVPLAPVTLAIAPAGDDDDGDGIPNGVEIALGLDPFFDDSADDPDQDGLDNFAEFLAGTDPMNPDTDGDGDLDGVDLEPLSGNRPPVAGVPAAGQALALSDGDTFVLPTTVRVAPPLALELWVAPEPTAAPVWVYRSCANAAVAIDYDGERFRFHLRTAQGPVVLPASLTAAADTWHHVAWTHDGTTLRAYLDGKLVVAQLVAGAPDYDALGHAPLLGGPGFAGLLDEVRVFATHRPGNAVQLDYLRHFDDAPGLVGVWPMHDGAVASGAPLRGDRSLVADAGINLAVRLSGFDPDGDPIVQRVTRLPSGGRLYQTNNGTTPTTAITTVPTTVTHAQGDVIYQPLPDFYGDDSFEHGAWDGALASAPAAVRIAIPPARTWVGGAPAGPSAWTVADNWSPTGVPAATDDVLIPADAAVFPLVSGATGIRSLVIEPGAELTIQTVDLTLSGHLVAAGPTLGSGRIVMNGNNTTVRGVVTRLLVRNAVTLAGPTSVLDVLRIESEAARLVVGAQSLDVAGDLQAYGRLVMQDPAGRVTVQRHATFGGISTTGSYTTSGFLTAGVMTLRGHFTQLEGAFGIDNTFDGTVDHHTVLAGAEPQTISFQRPAAARFRHLTIDNAAGVTFASNVWVSGDLMLVPPSVIAAGDRNLTVGGNFTLPSGGSLTGFATLAITGDFTVEPDATLSGSSVSVGGAFVADSPISLTALTVGGEVDVRAAFDVATTTFNGSTAALQSDLPYHHLRITGAATLAGPITITGDLTIQGNSGLTLAGHDVTIAGNLNANGGLRMTSGTPLVTVGGNATFGGVGTTGGYTTNGLLTHGTIIVRGDFTQLEGVFGTDNTFFATSDHHVILSGPSSQSVSFQRPANSRFRHLTVDNPQGVAFTTNMRASGDVAIVAPTPTTASNTTLTIDGSSVLATGASLTGFSTLSLGGAFTLEQDAILSGNHLIVAGLFTAESPLVLTSLELKSEVDIRDSFDVVTTTYSGSTLALQPDLPYHHLRITGAATLAGPITVTGDLTIQGNSGLTLAGFDVTLAGNLIANGGLRMTAGTPIVTVGGNATFGGVGTTGGYTTNGLLTHGTLIVRGDFTQLEGVSSTDNTFVATSDHRVILSGPSSQTVSFQRPASSRFRHLTIDNPQGVTFTTNMRASGDVTIVAPTPISASNTTITIDGSSALPTGASLTGFSMLSFGGAFTLAQDAVLSGNHLIVAGLFTAESPLVLTSLELKSEVDIRDSFDVVTTTFSGVTLALQSDLPYHHLRITGAATLAGPITVAGDLTLQGNSGLTLAGHDVAIAGNLNANGGLRMTSGTPSVTVTGHATFGGVGTTSGYNTSGLLTHGTLIARGDFTQLAGTNNTANTFVATSDHRVILSGPSSQTVSFQNPTSSRFHHLTVDNPQGVAFTTNMRASGDVTIVAPTPITASNTTLTIDGSSVLPTATSLTGFSTLSLGGAFTLEEDAFLSGTNLIVAGLIVAESPLVLTSLELKSEVDIRDLFDVVTTTYSGTTLALQPDLPYHHLRITGPATLVGPIAVGGDLTIQGNSGLTLAGHDVAIAGNLNANGGLRMTTGTPIVTVGGHATFGGVGTTNGYNTNGLLSHGTLIVHGDFTQNLGANNVTTTFVPTLEHRTVLTGSAPRTVSFQRPANSRFRDLTVTNPHGVTFVTNVAVNRDLDLVAMLTNASGLTATVTGTLTLRATSLLDNQGTMTVGACSKEEGHQIVGVDPCP